MRRREALSGEGVEENKGTHAKNRQETLLQTLAGTSASITACERGYQDFIMVIIISRGSGNKCHSETIIHANRMFEEQQAAELRLHAVDSMSLPTGLNMGTGQ